MALPVFSFRIGALILTFGVAAAACSGPSMGTGGGSTGGTGGTGGATTTVHGMGPVARHSSSIAVSPEGLTIYVVNADADSVSVIDAMGRKLSQEILLAAAPPVADADGRFVPAVGPRALALSPGAGRLYVTGERSSKLYGIDLASGKVVLSVVVGSEPVGVLVSPEETSVYVACSNDGTVVRVDATSGDILATAKITDGNSPLGFPIQAEPWALGWSLDASTLYVSHLVAPNVSAHDPTTLAVQTSFTIPDVAPRGNKLLANGQARGLYDVVARPGSAGEIWVAHMMLAVGTPETTSPTTSLDFQSTAFPTLSILQDKGSFVTRLSTNAMSVAGDTGAFGDIVSGPHALEFTADGKWALMLNSASEDILAVNADPTQRVEAQALHPLYQGDLTNAGHMQEGLVISPDGKYAYIDERNTSSSTWNATQAYAGPDVAVIAIDTSDPTTIKLTVDGPPILRLSKDPMPLAMRHGQYLFNTANSDAVGGVGITQNHWVACASCHVEGRSDAVTWKFLEGPRDTPSNAGGKSDTGFLLRTADRRVVADYWITVDREQGGSFGGTVDASGVAHPPTDPKILQDMQDIQTYVNFGIPKPVPPTTDPTLVMKGAGIFTDPTVGCSFCHSGTAYTNSGEGNASLSLEGAVSLADVGTCVTTGFPDVAHHDEDGNPRAACMFNTPSLRGVASSPPYLHDGSAATLHDVLAITKGKMGDTTKLSSSDLDALVEFLRSL